MVMQGSMSGSDFAAFMLYSEGVQGSMGELAGQVPSVMTALGAGEKVFELIALQPTIPSGSSGRYIPYARFRQTPCRSYRDCHGHA
jgi:ABC-type multidrug transport system fused ATPase/permease subunit